MNQAYYFGKKSYDRKGEDMQNELFRIIGGNMAYSKFSGTYQSSNHKNRIFYYILEPETELRAIVQLTHGWKDYIERNDELIKFFTDHGIMVCGCDFIGHGRSSEEEELGHFDEQNGWSYLVKDVKKLAAYMKKEYPETPFFLYGHGMGSLVARLCCLHDPLFDGVILSGTSGKQKYCRRCIFVTAILRRIKGWNHRSRYLEKLIYKRLNRKFKSEKSDFSWFSDHEEIREKYAGDARCQFIFTISAYENIFKMLSFVSAKKWYQSVDRDLPILLISGKEDPVGDFGKGVSSVYYHLVETGHSVQMNLYEGIRHELQECTKSEEIFTDVLNWMKLYMEE